MISIVGAGLAGLLAGRMLRDLEPVIYEMQSALPNNHSAVLRFRSSVVGDTINIPFKKVTLTKDVIHHTNPIADALAYSFKNTGKYRSDRSIIAGRVVADRWIAPSDLISRMAKNQTINYNHKVLFGTARATTPTISTLPMPWLMRELNYQGATASFDAVAGLNIRARIKDCEAYVSLAIPDPLIPFSRLSITGDELILEIPNFNMNGLSETWLDEVVAKSNISMAAKLLNIPECVFHDVSAKPQSYAKITPVEDDVRKNFIHWATDQHNIYSLGRFATWRPGLLMDDLVNDIRLIERWINKQDRYAVALHR